MIHVNGGENCKIFETSGDSDLALHTRHGCKSSGSISFPLLSRRLRNAVTCFAYFRPKCRWCESFRDRKNPSKEDRDGSRWERKECNFRQRKMRVSIRFIDVIRPPDAFQQLEDHTKRIAFSSAAATSIKRHAPFFGLSLPPLLPSKDRLLPPLRL